MRRNKDDYNFELTEPVILAFEREKEDAKLLKKFKRGNGYWTSIIFRIFFILIIIGAIIYIVFWYKNNRQNIKELNQLTEQFIVQDENEDDEISIDFEGLQQRNSSCVGWIVVNNTNINYPVVKHTNNDYYLAHSFDKKSNAAGWIYTDYRNKADGSDKNLVLYGHNRKDGSMFGSLNTAFSDEEWAKNEENKIITYYTPNGNFEYEIFSFYNVPVEEYFATISFFSDSAYKKFIKTVSERSKYKYDTSIDDIDSIITISTCGATSETRTVIHAKKITSE